MFEYSEDLAVKLLEFVESNRASMKATHEGRKVYKMCISKEVVDRDGEIIRLSGMDKKWYMMNPVVLEDHQYKLSHIIGKTIKIYIEGNRLYADYVFADNEKGNLYEKMLNEGFIFVSSIGFMVKERDINDRNIITKRELLEWSLCAVSCNREALTEGQKSLLDTAESLGLVQKGFKSVDEDHVEILSDFIDPIKEEKKVEQEITLKDIMNAIAENTNAIKALNEKVDKSLTDGKVKEAETLDEDLEAKKLNAQTAQKLLQQALQNLKIAIN